MIKNRFALEQPLDHVRVGTLYRAVDTLQAADGPYRHVALWVLPAHVGGEQHALTALSRDFARIRGLVHPNIARVLNLDQDGDTFFVTAELLDGETLRTVLDCLHAEKLDSREADQVVQAIGAALAYAHDRGVVHGEVRAENVLVTMDQRFKLTNFLMRNLLRSARPSARPADDLRDLALLAGSLYSGAPLQRRGRTLLLKGVPKLRAKAIEAVLNGTTAWRDGGVRDFLARAGLAVEPPLDRPAGAARSTGAAARPNAWVRRAGTVVPIAGLAFAGFVLYQSAAGREWLDRLAAVPGTATASAGRDAAAPPTAAAASEPAADVTPPPAAAAAPPDDAKPARTLPVTLHRDPPPRQSATDAAAGADESGPTVLSFTTPTVTAREGQSLVTLDILRSGDASEKAAIVWWTTDGTAHARDDYASFGRRVETFAPGERIRHISIPIASDSVPEEDEYFDVHLDPHPTGAKLGPIDRVRVTLIDDDRWTAPPRSQDLAAAPKK